MSVISFEEKIMAKKDYKRTVLEYLLQHENKDIEREILISDIGISKSRLSEILKSIREDGYSISSPPRSGLIRLDKNENHIVLPSIKDVDLREWLIIFILSQYGSLSFRDLIIKILSIKDYDADYPLTIDDKKVYDDNHLIKSFKSFISDKMSDEYEIDVAEDYLSVTTLRKDLTSLRKKGFVRLKEGQKTTYELTSKAPYILYVPEDRLSEFCQTYEDHVTSISGLKPLKEVYDKIRTQIAWDDMDTVQRRFGRQAQISQDQIDKFNNFVSHQYKTNRLTIHSFYGGKEKHETISVGLIFYCVETGAFYALCHNHSKCKIMTIRLDYIDDISDNKEKNKIFHNDEYYKKYKEMFAAGYDQQVHHVKVLFKDFGNIKERFVNLTKIRSEASLRPIEEPPKNCIYDFIYEDNVRGLSDFARFLRSFGYSVLVMEPIELRDMMVNTYKRFLEKYNALEGVINES